MSHEITATDNLFSVRSTPWHNLGEVLTDYPTREEAQAIAHPWEPVATPVYQNVPMIDPLTGALTDQFLPIEGQKLVERSDNGAALGVVGEGYEPVQNSEMYDIAEALQETAPEDVRFETGGSIQGGKKVWLMLRLNEPLEVSGDPLGATLPFYTLQNSHDGSGSFRGQATNVRVVCQNTMKASDLSADQHGTEFVFRHTKNVRDRIEEAKTALAMWRENLRMWQVTMDELVKVEITPRQREIFITELVPAPTGRQVSQRVMTNIENSRAQLTDILFSETTRDTAHTAYGLVAAATEWNQWVRSVRGKDVRGRMESRFKRQVLTSDRFGADVIELAREVANA